MAMERNLEAPLATLSVDGGPTHDDLLMQVQANVLGRPVKRLNVQELSAFGAAVLAAREAEVRAWKAAVRSVIDDAAL